MASIKSIETQGQITLSSQQKLIGLLGGSFNPPHMGHLAISLHCIEFLTLHKLWWVITNSNPLKNHCTQCPYQTKLMLANSIIQHSNKISLHCFDHISIFTIDIVTYLIRSKPTHNKYMLIIGIDNYYEFYKWKNWLAIPQLLPLIVYNRPTSKQYNFYELADQYQHSIVNNTEILHHKLPCVTFIPNQLSNLSSNKLII